ncbi:hypothetical protein AJ78_04948 [Emergomyces pasteurianus Ep9510]|uniref:Uncharacterized protein n=1 Tax=Emergomyces pasteurianus Ep9510 TaxID=1447872 RepID=A0A1J9Q3E6_9EURO|nr:hypothetical protein AJ78_04948 [Emergomyces pasteurianus Ep9510]
MDCGGHKADNSNSDPSTAQNPESALMPTQNGRNNYITDSDLIKGRNNNQATTAAPNSHFSGQDLPPYNPRSAVDAQRELPPLGGVLDEIARDVENSDSPCIEYVLGSNAQYLNDMRNLLHVFSGMPITVRNWEITLPPLNFHTLGDIHTDETVLPTLHDVLNDIAKGLENTVWGFVPIVVPADSNAEYLLNMKMAFRPISSDIGNVTNQPSGTGSNNARIPRSPNALSECSIIHGRATTPNLSNSLINQPF